MATEGSTELDTVVVTDTPTRTMTLVAMCETDAHVPIGRARTHGDGSDLTLVSFANGRKLTVAPQPRGFVTRES